MDKPTADFSGWVTKANLRCSDGRTIQPDAFKHQDGVEVPLVWSHKHDSADNVLGHVLLENRPEGVYGYGFLNKATKQGQNAAALVEHRDIRHMSIWANQLVERAKQVYHGAIKEVSLVLAGANPGAVIENVHIAHSSDPDDYTELPDEAIIHTGLELEHEDPPAEGEEAAAHADTATAEDETTLADVYDTLNEDQKKLFSYVVAQAVEEAASGTAEHSELSETGSESGSESETEEQASEEAGDQSETGSEDGSETDSETGSEDGSNDDNTGTEEDLAHQEGNNEMKTAGNVFDQTDDGANQGTVLSHADQLSIFAAAKQANSLKEAVESYALKHGIDDIDILFPDAKAVTNTPDFMARRMEWVNVVMTETRHTPFSRIKSLLADLTLEEARAKGYVKGNLKREEFFRVSKRVTTPQTVYKKQKLDRDDILDITDFDVVVWLKGEMRLMLEEEIARAILLGDGRDPGDDDKIKEDHIRPIASDDDLYITTLRVNLGDASSSAEELIDALVLNRRHYRGSGNPTFFTSETVLAKLLLVKDTLGRRVYPTVNDVAVAIRASKIVTVEVMDEPNNDVLGILVNLADYTVGADKGGDVSLFDDFDIDYNQYKYLIEARMSGALVRWKAALVVRQVADSDTLVVPVAPDFDPDLHTVTVATTSGITYKNKATNTTLTTGAPVTLAEGDELTVIAVPDSGKYIASSAEDEFGFNYDGPTGSAF